MKNIKWFHDRNRFLNEDDIFMAGSISRLSDDIELMIGSRPGYFWLLCWRFLGPIAMVVIFVASLIEIFSKGVTYEVWNSLKVHCLFQN